MRNPLGKVISGLGLSIAAFAMFSLAPREASAAAWYNCVPTAIFEYNGELEVSCSNAYSGSITWIGATISSLSTQQQDRFVQWATAAILSGKRFRVFMTDNACPVQGGATCRLASSWSLYPAP